MVVKPQTVSPSATPMMFPATPAIFQQGLPPWAVQTPEVSPMLWERAPRGQQQRCAEDAGSQQGSQSAAGGPSKDLLRKVCEPFFEQMLVALQEVLTQQTQSPYMGSNYTMTVEEEPAFGSCFASHVVQEESDGSEAGEGAFASVLVPQEVAPQHSAPARKQAQPMNVVNNDGDKAANPTVMVCRHWKSKGWCRLGADCKFSHPDHKCGVGSANANKGNHAAAVAAPSATDMNAVVQGLASIGNGNSSDEGPPGVLGDGAKRSRNRKSKDRGAGKGQPSPLDSFKQAHEQAKAQASAAGQV